MGCSHEGVSTICMFDVCEEFIVMTEVPCAINPPLPQARLLAWSLKYSLMHAVVFANDEMRLETRTELRRHWSLAH